MGASKPSIASVIGDYYLQNFNGLAGEGNISCIDNGINWLIIKSIREGTSPYPKVYSDAYKFNNTVAGFGQSNIAWFNFTQPTTHINFSISPSLSAASGSHYSLLTYNIYTNSGSIMAYMTITATYFGGTETKNLSLYNPSGVLIYYATVTSTVSCIFDIYLNGNSSIRIVSSGTFSFNKCISISNFDYTIKFYFKLYHGYVSGISSMILDNFYFLTGLSHPWEITTDYEIGSLTVSESGNRSNTLTTTQTFQIVEKYPLNSYGSLDLKQLAFSISTSSELSKITIILHINGIDLGYYDDSYFYSGSSSISPRYILVWKNIDESFTTPNLNIEILITAITKPAIFSYPVYVGDIEDDGIISMKESTGLSSVVLAYLNGAYDGSATFTVIEPIYKMWFDSTGGIGLCGDFTGYESIGETFGSLPTSFTTDTLEQEYDIVSSFTLFGVELPIHTSQYTFDSDYTNYHVRINGAVFYACSIKNYLPWEKIVVFDLTDRPIAIIDEKVLFEFYNDNGKLNGMITSLDRDFDGNRNLKHGDNTENGVYDGSLWGVNVEFLYRFYYTSMVIPTENPGLGNSISFGGYAKKNSSIPLYYLNDSLYSGVIVYSTVDSLIPDRYVRLYYANNHTEITISDFPLLMDNYFMASGVIAFSVGNFYVNISNYDETMTYAHSHFDVINNPDESDMWIQSEPPITLCLEDYTITYKYLQENGHMGCIAMFLDDDIYNIGDSYYHGFLISSNTTDSFSYRPLMGGCGNQYWTFFVYINGTYFPTGMMHIHMQYTGDTENNIDTLPKNNAFIGDEVTIYGNHNFIGQDIRILFNGVTKYYVGMEQSFSYPTIFTKTGAVNITLCRYLSNSSYDYLDSVIIMISENEEIKEPIVLLEPPFSYIAGAILTILFLVMPVILIGTTVKDIMQSDLLKYIPVFSGSLGFIVSCLIGFFPWYAIFILVSIIVMILAVLYLSKKNQ
jgi:hypothetical protein